MNFITYWRYNLVIFDYSAAKELKEYAIVLSKLLNYKWAQLLEKFNFCPKIANKVSGISEAKLSRNSLSKYKDELLAPIAKGDIVGSIKYKVDDIDHRAASCKQGEQDEHIYPYHERESHEHFIHDPSPQPVIHYPLHMLICRGIIGLCQSFPSVFSVAPFA